MHGSLSWYDNIIVPRPRSVVRAGNGFAAEIFMTSNLNGTAHRTRSRRAVLGIACFLLLGALHAPAYAQLEAGIWGGISSSSIPYTRSQPGLGFGATALWRLSPAWGVRVSGGIMQSAFANAEYTLLPPESERTFHVRIEPVELVGEWRTASNPDDGSFVLDAGAAVVHFGRNTVEVRDTRGDTTTIGGLSITSVGAVVGVGVETGRFAGDHLRAMFDAQGFFGLTGLDDSGKRPGYLRLCAGVLYVF